MGKRDTVEVLLIILYVTGALITLITAYYLYIRKYRKRGKLKVLNDVILHTSRYDQFTSETQFLLELPKETHVKLTLLNSSEQQVANLLDEFKSAGEYPITFNPLQYENGDYFLHLESENATLMRKIHISK